VRSWFFESFVMWGKWWCEELFFFIKFAFWVSLAVWVCRCNNLPAAGMGL